MKHGRKRLREGLVAAVHSSFGSACRFPSRKCVDYQFYDLPSALAKRSCGFGYGKRWTPTNPRGKDSPPPTTYQLASSFGSRSPSFGTARKSDREPQQSPGPAEYDPLKPIGSEAVKISFRGRLERPASNATPPPTAYRPKYSLVESNSYGQISFGPARSSAKRLRSKDSRVSKKKLTRRTFSQRKAVSR